MCDRTPCPCNLIDPVIIERDRRNARRLVILWIILIGIILYLWLGR